MADIVKNVMNETGISITDFLAAAIEIAHQEHPSELVNRRDDIIQGLYDVIPCIKCANMEIQHVHSTEALISEAEESSNPPMDLSEANFSDQSPEMEVAKDSHKDKEEPSEKTGIRIVIKLNKNKNKSADATEKPKSEETKAIEAPTSNNNKNKMDDFQNEDISRTKFNKAAKRKLHESNELAANAKCLKNEEEDINGIKFENARRKLHEGYELAANTKKQRCVKMVPPQKLTTQKLGKNAQQKNQHGTSAKARIESKLNKLKMNRR